MNEMENRKEQEQRLSEGKANFPCYRNGCGATVYRKDNKRSSKNGHYYCKDHMVGSPVVTGTISKPATIAGWTEQGVGPAGRKATREQEQAS